MNTIIIIGGGAAGMFAAINAKTSSNRVILLESNNKLGKKLAITGKGRCNLTNISDISDFIAQVNSNPEFMYGPFYTFTNVDLINFFEQRNLKTKTERGGRVFPVSDTAFDVIDVLRSELVKVGVEIKLNSTVLKIEKHNSTFSIKTAEDKYTANKCIITTGGCSYPKTGSNGSGFELSKQLGHKIIPPLPSLVPIEVKETWISELTGVSLRNVELSLYKEKKKLHSEFGEMLFSHYGLSGPIVLTMSNYIEPSKDYSISIDLKPALDKETLDKRILRDFNKYTNKAIKNSLSDLTINSLIPVILRLANIDPDKPVNQISKAERKKLVDVFKGIILNFKSLRPIEEAIITRGGVDVDEINPSTMESKLIDGLYFAGEIIDVDANTGGYNLQIAFSTAYVAGINSKGDY